MLLSEDLGIRLFLHRSTAPQLSSVATQRADCKSFEKKQTCTPMHACTRGLHADWCRGCVLLCIGGYLVIFM